MLRNLERNNPKKFQKIKKTKDEVKKKNFQRGTLESKNV
jgi:hypothetical protein